MCAKDRDHGFLPVLPNIHCCVQGCDRSKLFRCATITVLSHFSTPTPQTRSKKMKSLLTSSLFQVADGIWSWRGDRDNSLFGCFSNEHTAEFVGIFTTFPLSKFFIVILILQ